MHLAATLGTASILMNWDHERTPLSDDIKYVLLSYQIEFEADHSIARVIAA